MLIEYINTALELAKYEMIENDEPFYAQIEELQGVWACGKNLEECRRNLKESIESWLIFSLQNGYEIPILNNLSIQPKIEEYA